MKTWFYSWIVYPLIFCLASVFGFFNQKVRRTLRLRSWKTFLSLRTQVEKPIHYWIHVASSGEMEYAVPLIQELGRRGQQILMTYYSISAKGPVENLPKKYDNVCLVVPLPHDGLGLMAGFVKLVKGQGVKRLLLLKYELWPGLLWECQHNGIQVVLVDALKPGWFHQKLLHKLYAIISGYESELSDFKHARSLVLGDTRVERVLERLGLVQTQKNETNFQWLKKYQENTLILGSIWPQDWQIIAPVLKTLVSLKMNLLVVPHEKDSSFTAKLLSDLKKAGFITGISDSAEEFTCSPTASEPWAHIVDFKGALVELYSFGRGAYVGGGFKQNVHSVWEPALAQLYVSCGPKRQRSPESFQLEQAQILTEVTNAEEFGQWAKKIKETSFHSSKSLENLIHIHKGASKRIIDFLEAPHPWQN